jgi:hypothetical protein
MTLAERFGRALDLGADALETLPATDPDDRTDRFATLLQIYGLHMGDVAALGDRARWQQHPAVSALKWRLEGDWLVELEEADAKTPLVGDPVSAMRALAAADRLPDVYRWVARTAELPEIVEFLSLEGGPDAGFDDLVAACQLGLKGEPKLEMARNYWDEMGDGAAADVHTTLHDNLVEALGVRAIPTEEQPETALERTALGGLLATNHWLQPEMVGALGLIELQAGPRCRLVLDGLRRVGAPEAALPFYAVHHAVDPMHGRDWLDNAVAPLIARHPSWGERIVRGARWRSRVNAAFFADVWRLLSPHVPAPSDVRGRSVADGAAASAGGRAEEADAA